MVEGVDDSFVKKCGNLLLLYSVKTNNLTLFKHLLTRMSKEIKPKNMFFGENKNSLLIEFCSKYYDRQNESNQREKQLARKDTHIAMLSLLLDNQKLLSIDLNYQNSLGDTALM